MTEPNELIHQSLRLKTMAALYADVGEKRMEFKRLKTLVGATDGNLWTHLSALESAGYIELDKVFVGNRLRTCVAITPPGIAAFRKHAPYLRGIIG